MFRDCRTGIHRSGKVHLTGYRTSAVLLRRARLMASAQRSAIIAAYRRALKIARDWPRTVGDFDQPPSENTVAAQNYIRNEARQLVEQNADERNGLVIRKYVPLSLWIVPVLPRSVPVTLHFSSSHMPKSNWRYGRRYSGTTRARKG